MLFFLENVRGCSSGFHVLLRQYFLIDWRISMVNLLSMEGCFGLMKTVLKSIMVGLAASFVLLSPLVFLPADTGLLVGLVLGFLAILLFSRISGLKLTPVYLVFSCIVLTGAQTQLHSKLWPHQLVENISLLIGIGILLFFMMAVVMILYALLVGKWR